MSLIVYHLSSEITNHKMLVEKRYTLTFALVTSLFALWGFANDITNPLVAAFRTVMEISNAKASLVQFAFYGGYATMAIPAALFIRRFSYKNGILLGLMLYAFGAFMFIPAANTARFGLFCISLYVLTFGLAFLETTANPYILSLGDKSTATRRLNLAQSFNPMGSLLGMFVASHFILANLQCDAPAVRLGGGFSELPEAERLVIRAHDLDIIRDPYVALGFVVLIIFVVILFFVGNRPIETTERPVVARVPAALSLRRLFACRIYREGVVAQLFYVGAQIMCWTFIIQYAENLGIDKATAQNYNIVAMTFFLISRIVSTILMKYFDSRRMLAAFAFGGMLTTLGVVFVGGMAGLWCLVATSAFMSLMFPTIYGIALSRVRPEDTPLGAAFLVEAIVGGSILPLAQGALIDCGTIFGLPAVNASFLLTLICFAVIAIYAYRSVKLPNTR